MSLVFGIFEAEEMATCLQCGTNQLVGVCKRCTAMYVDDIIAQYSSEPYQELFHVVSVVCGMIKDKLSVCV